MWRIGRKVVRGKWRVAATVVATAAVYAGRRVFRGGGGEGSEVEVSDDDSSDEDFLARDDGKPPRRKRKRTSSVVPFFRLLVVPVVLLVLALVVTVVGLFALFNDKFVQQYPSYLDLYTRMALWASFIWQTLCLIPLFLQCQQCAYFRSLVLQTVSQSAFIGVYFAVQSLLAGGIAAAICFLYYEYHFINLITFADFQLYLLIATFDLLLICFSQYIYGLIQDTGSFLLMEKKNKSNQICNFHPPSLLFLRIGTFAWKCLFASTSIGRTEKYDCDKYNTKKVMFFTNLSPLHLGTPMLIRSCYEKFGIYPRVVLGSKWFSIPFLNELLRILGAVKMTNHNLDKLALSGECILIIVDNNSLQNLGEPMKKMINLAMQWNYDIVPVVTIGIEENLYLPLVMPWKLQRVYYFFGNKITFDMVQIISQAGPSKTKDSDKLKPSGEIVGDNSEVVEHELVEKMHELMVVSFNQNHEELISIREKDNRRYRFSFDQCEAKFHSD